tara:strand:+ start:1659 stop:2156 length:498 start_codon:yes stop_codon:yes gene_type:complete
MHPTHSVLLVCLVAVACSSLAGADINSRESREKPTVDFHSETVDVENDKEIRSLWDISERDAADEDEDEQGPLSLEERGFICDDTVTNCTSPSPSPSPTRTPRTFSPESFYPPPANSPDVNYTPFTGLTRLDAMMVVLVCIIVFIIVLVLLMAFYGREGREDFKL